MKELHAIQKDLSQYNKILKSIAFINALFLTIPAFYFVYVNLFPIIYFLLIFITKDDKLMFFWAYWVLELGVLYFSAKALLKLFKKLSRRNVQIFTFVSLIIFSVFGISTFHNHRNFPARTVPDIKNDYATEVESALSHSTNNHSIPETYNADKRKISNGFKNYLDTMTRKDYPDNQDNIYHEFFGYYEKESLDTIKNILVDTIIYDETSLKMYVGIIYQTKSNWYYGQGFIGYKKTLASPIVLYPFQYSTITATTNSIEESKKALRKNFFIDLRKHADYKNDSLIPYKFSPLDAEFWKGIYFTKGPDIDSLYFFQTEENPETQKRTSIPPTLTLK